MTRRKSRGVTLDPLAEDVFLLGSGWYGFSPEEQADFRRAWNQHGAAYLANGGNGQFALRKFGEPGGVE